jgi:hypothetical protein
VPRKVPVRKRVVENVKEQAQEAAQAVEQVLPTRSGRKPVKRVIFDAGKN